MEFVSVDLKRCTYVGVSGIIDGSNALEFGNQLRNLTNAGLYKLVLNMREVPVIKPAGLREMISIWKSCRWNRGDMRIAEPVPNVMKVLELTDLSNMFKIYRTEAEAVDSFNLPLNPDSR